LIAYRDNLNPKECEHMMQQNQQHAPEGEGQFRPSTTSRIKRSVDTFYTYTLSRRFFFWCKQVMLAINNLGL
jgi:hypothetical protein